MTVIVMLEMADGELKKPTTWSPDTKVYAYYSSQVLNHKKKQHF